MEHQNRPLFGLLSLWPVYLVMKFEECIVDDEIVSLEPLEEVADDGEPVDHSGCHGEAELGAGVEEPLLPLGSRVSKRSRSSHSPQGFLLTNLKEEQVCETSETDARRQQRTDVSRAGIVVRLRGHAAGVSVALWCAAAEQPAKPSSAAPHFPFTLDSGLSPATGDRRQECVADDRVVDTRINPI